MTFVVTNYLYKNILHGLWLTLTLPAKPQSNSSIGSQGYERYRRQWLIKVQSPPRFLVVRQDSLPEHMKNKDK